MGIIFELEDITNIVIERYKKEIGMENLNIRELRTELGNMSKYRLAKTMKVSWNTIHLWEKGIYKPSFVHLEKLLNLLSLYREGKYDEKKPPVL